MQVGQIAHRTHLNPSPNGKFIANGIHDPTTEPEPSEDDHDGSDLGLSDSGRERDFQQLYIRPCVWDGDTQRPSHSPSILELSRSHL